MRKWSAPAQKRRDTSGVNRGRGRRVALRAPNAAAVVLVSAAVLQRFHRAEPDPELRLVIFTSGLVWGVDEMFRGATGLRRLLGTAAVAGLLAATLAPVGAKEQQMVVFEPDGDWFG